MKHFWLTAKIAFFFALLLGGTLFGILILFMHVAGHQLIDELGRLKALEGVALAEDVEGLLRRGHGLNDPAVRDLLGRAGRHHGATLTLKQPPQSALNPAPKPWHREFHNGPIDVRGRRCFVASSPAGELWIPVLGRAGADGEPVAPLHLIMRGPAHADVIHMAFRRGLLLIAGFTLLGVLALAAYLTTPLRHMSRSMDRVADGDLDHRVTVRGHDEVATMGRSFNRMTDRVQGMLRGQKELLAAVSHELRSPMTRMKMALELLRQSSPEQERLGDIDAEIDHMDALVDQLLAASRYELGSAEQAARSVDLRQAVNDAWQRTFAPDVPMKCIQKIDDDAAELTADPAAVAHIFDNLFANARRYVGSGTVTVNARRRGPRVRLTVADQGPGVTEAHLDRLFEPFFRADPSRGHDGSVGLGLMVVDKAVRAHGGTITASSNSPRGLVLSFDLPASTRPV